MGQGLGDVGAMGAVREQVLNVRTRRFLAGVPVVPGLRPSGVGLLGDQVPGNELAPEILDGWHHWHAV
jgi:hypothetical protein